MQRIAIGIKYDSAGQFASGTGAGQCRNFVGGIQTDAALEPAGETPKGISAAWESIAPDSSRTVIVFIICFLWLFDLKTDSHIRANCLKFELQFWAEIERFWANPYLASQSTNVGTYALTQPMQLRV